MHRMPLSCSAGLFHKKATNYTALWRKTTCQDKAFSLYVLATLYDLPRCGILSRKSSGLRLLQILQFYLNLHVMRLIHIWHICSIWFCPYLSICTKYPNNVSSHGRALDLDYYDSLDLGCLIFLGHCLQTNPIISGSFAEKDLQLMATVHPLMEELWI